MEKLNRVLTWPVLVFALATVIIAPAAIVAGCEGNKPKVEAAKTGVIACVKADAPDLLAFTGKLLASAAKSVLKLGAPEWDGLADQAIAEGKELGGCAFAAIYAAFEKAEPEVAVRSLSAGPSPREAALARVRTQLGAPGWQLADGTVVQ